MSIPVVIICGQSKSGKDTLADYLVQNFGGIRISMADPIKALMQDIFGLEDEVWWGSSDFRNVTYSSPSFFGNKRLKWTDLDGHSVNCCAHSFNIMAWSYQFEKTFTPRKVLQTFGTEVVRTLYPNFWVDEALRRAKLLLMGGYEYDKKEGLIPNPQAKAPGFVVISDGRFRNEIINAKTVGATAIKIYRDNSDSKTQVAGVPNHSSEMEIEGIPRHFYDIEVNNNGTLATLHKKGFVIATQILHLDKPKDVL
jgi:hypothetical protein